VPVTYAIPPTRHSPHDSHAARGSVPDCRLVVESDSLADMSLSDGKPMTPSGAAVPPPQDGRQSDAALAIARGTCRHLIAHGAIPLAELTLPNGRRADLVGVTDKSEIWIVEIKSSIEDFRSDQKWPEYADYCDRFFFAVDGDFPLELIPDEAGLIVADRYGAAIIREAPFDRMPPANRKSVMVRYARTSAARLQALYDPEMAYETRAIRE
jgi:hypothetical protein